MQGVKISMPQKDIIERYYCNHSAIETASYFEVSVYTLWSWCQKLGIKKRTPCDPVAQKLKKSESNKRWRQNNREKFRQYKRKYYSSENGKRHRKNDSLKVYYGISLDEYEEMLASQCGQCAICQVDKPGHGHKYFCVDHDHKTKANRGLLCHKCNRGIGFFEDDVQNMEQAIKYIIKYKEINEQYPPNATV